MLLQVKKSDPIDPEMMLLPLFGTTDLTEDFAGVVFNKVVVTCEETIMFRHPDTINNTCNMLHVLLIIWGCLNVAVLFSDTLPWLPGTKIWTFSKMTTNCKCLDRVCQNLSAFSKMYQ